MRKRPLNHVLQSQQFDRELLERIFMLARKMERVLTGNRWNPKIFWEKLCFRVKVFWNLFHRQMVAMLFYEPSTRTRLSFEAAAQRLGGSVEGTEDANTFSSAAKGETIEDTVRVIGCYADAVIIRSKENGLSARAAAASPVPIINAGDGTGQHPTQALLDLFTIEQELGHIDGVKITMVGDLKNGRTVRSLCYLLVKNYRDVKIRFVSPRNLRMRDDIKTYLSEHGVRYEETPDMQAAVAWADIVYMTRVQKERFEEGEEGKIDEKFIFDAAMLEHLQPHARIMHPLPRVGEITEDVDQDQRAAYFRQVRNGLFVRMALLRLLLGW